MTFTLNPITPEAVELNRAFLSYEPPVSAARQRAMAAAAAAKKRIEDLLPLGTFTERVIEQDEASGLLMAGERTVTLHADAEASVGDAVFPHAPNEETRAAAALARRTAEVAEQREAELASGVDIAGVGRIDVSTSALLALSAKAQMATIAIQREAHFEATIPLVGGGSATLDADETIGAFYQASQYVAAVDAQERDLTSQLAAQSTAEEIAACDVAGGWPPDQPRVAGKFVKSTTPSPDA